MPGEEEIIKNLRRCPYFDKCNQNLCPLDLELHLRSGNSSDKCKWMKEPVRKKIKGREFISGGQAMPDNILNFVPEANLKWLNRASQKRWFEIKKCSGEEIKS
jgi:hypothetical protein